MKKTALKLSMILSVIALGACTGERTSRYFFKNVPMMNLASPSPSVLTADIDPTSQNGIRSHEHDEEHETVISGVLEQKDLQLLYESMQVDEVTLPLEDPQTAIPIRKIEKTIGRLSCFQKFPFINDEELMRLKTRYECHFLKSVPENADFQNLDRTLYENLSMEEKESDGIFLKRSALLECSKSVHPSNGSVTYNCKTI